MRTKHASYVWYVRVPKRSLKRARHAQVSCEGCWHQLQLIFKRKQSSGTTQSSIGYHMQLWAIKECWFLKRCIYHRVLAINFQQKICEQNMSVEVGPHLLRGNKKRLFRRCSKLWLGLRLGAKFDVKTEQASSQYKRVKLPRSQKPWQIWSSLSKEWWYIFFLNE